MAADQPRIDDPESLVARALRSVLETIPEVPGGDVTPPEQSPTAQPWAETAAPAGRNKRPLEALLEEFRRRVAAAPEAKAALPDEPTPAQAYLDSLTAAASGGGRRGKRRWHGSRRRGGGGRRRGRGQSPASA